MTHEYFIFLAGFSFAMLAVGYSVGRACERAEWLAALDRLWDWLEES